jgi:hypothetical protein
MADAKRGRRSIGDAPMNGVQRNRRWKLKKFGEKPKAKASTDAERRQKRRDSRKRRKLMDRIIRASEKLAATTGGTMPLMLVVGGHVDVSKCDLSNYTDEPHRQDIYLTPHHMRRRIKRRLIPSIL